VIEITHEQATRLFEASEHLAALLMASACRVIYEADDDHDILPYLDKLPAKAVRDFDQAVAAIQWPDDAPQKPPGCRAIVAAVEDKNATILKKLRSDVFEILRRHNVSDQCFAEVAAVTHAAFVDKEQ
jgi:hypothetical protein